MQHGDDGPPRLVFLAQQIQQGISGFGIHRVKRLIQQQKARILRQHTGKQHALKLPVGKVADVAVSKIRHLHARQRMMHPLALRRRQPPKKADFIPQAHRRQLKHRQRLAAVNIRLLRQISNIAARQVLPLHATRMFEQPHNGFKQRGLARAVGPKNGIHAAIGKRHVHMVHSGARLIAHG